MKIEENNIYLITTEIGDLVVTVSLNYRINKDVWECFIYNKIRHNRISVHKDKFKKHLGSNIKYSLENYPEYFI